MEMKKLSSMSNHKIKRRLQVLSLFTQHCVAESLKTSRFRTDQVTVEKEGQELSEQQRESKKTMSNTWGRV
jgi:hypothetical protein